MKEVRTDYYTYILLRLQGVSCTIHKMHVGRTKLENRWKSFANLGSCRDARERERERIAVQSEVLGERERERAVINKEGGIHVA